MEPIVKNEIRIDLVYRLIIGNWKKFFIIAKAFSDETIFASG